jgi:protein-S-isoprenylcysteine O-methyltransferase Ste14
MSGSIYGEDCVSNFYTVVRRIGLSANSLDYIEKLLIAALLGGLALRLVPSALEKGNALPLILVASDCLLVAFILFRRPTQDFSRKWFDWLTGFSGTMLPLLAISPEPEPIIPIQICGIIMVAGVCLNVAAKFTLRRSFGVIAANRGVKIDGPYRLVRHPMYAGYVLTQVGFLLSGPSLWNLSIYAMAFAVQVARMNAEERILMRDPEYQAMVSRVPYRIVPYVY